MKVKKNHVFFITGSIICLAIIVLGIKFIVDYPYRTGLPELPDLKSYSIPLKEQISVADEKARKSSSESNLGNLGMVYHSGGFYDKAAKCYKLAVRKNKASWIWSYYLGYLNLEMGESETVIDNFREVIKEDPSIDFAWYYVGKCYENIGSSYKAEVSFQKIANLNEKRVPENKKTRNDYFPLRTYAMFQLARIYMNSNRIELAEQTLKQVLLFNRSFGPAYRLLGNVYRVKGDSSLSAYNIIRANDLPDFSPPVDTIIDKLALMSKSEYYILKQIDIAEKSIYPEWALQVGTNALKQFPENKYLISKTIKLLLRLDSGKLALPFLNKHISYYKEDYAEIKEIADLLYEKGFNAQSLIYYNQATKLKPEDFIAKSDLAISLWTSGMRENAINEITALPERDKNNIEALTTVISFFIMTGDRDKAILYLSRLKRLSSSNPIVTKFSGMIAENDGKIKEAIGFYESSFKSDPEDLSTIRYLGNILVKQKLWKKSIIHYRKALEFHPNEPDFLERIGSILVACPDLKLRNYIEAREFSERAFIHKGCPSDVLISAAKSLAEAYGELGDNRNAYTFMEIAIKLAKNQNAPGEYINNLEKRLIQYSTAN